MINKAFKMMAIFTLAICMSVMPGIVAHAETTNEVATDNDDMDHAQTIQANSETAAQAVSGSRPNQHVITGYTALNDQDWYKVYLTAGRQYMTCNDHSFNFQVRTENNTICSDTYVKMGYGPTAYPFDVPASGYYYVCINGITDSPVSYLFSIGGPTYSVAYCQVNLPSVTMVSNSDVTRNFALTDSENLPEGAIVYSIQVSGVRTNDVRSISLRNMQTSSNVNLQTYTWGKTGLVSMNMPLKAGWQITYGYNKNVSFSPNIRFYYAYPILGTSFDDCTINQR